jgi:two-component sensor histidine kinase
MLLLFGIPTSPVWRDKGAPEIGRAADMGRLSLSLTAAVVDGSGGEEATERPPLSIGGVTMRRPPEEGRGILAVAQPQPRPAEPKEDCRSAALARIAADAQLRSRRAEEALAEQRLLAREADHRVANGLQLVHCTLLLQATAAPEGVAQQVIRAAARSVAAIAEAHRHLYASVTIGPTPEAPPDAVAYLGALVRKLSSIALRDGQVADCEVVLRAEPDAASVVPAGMLPRLGLVTAELIANALKHGAGPVLVELRPGSEAEGGGAVVAVSDQGAGFPPEFEPATYNGESLGMRLLAVLARPGRIWVDLADRRRILVHLLDRTVPGSG